MVVCFFIWMNGWISVTPGGRMGKVLPSNVGGGPDKGADRRILISEDKGERCKDVKKNVLN